MNSLNVDFDFDSRMSQLESEWRAAYEDSMAARADYQALANSVGANTQKVNAKVLDKALERLDRSEAAKDRIMVKSERLEEAWLGAA